MRINFKKEEEMKEFLEACKPGTCPLEQMSFADGCDKNCDQCEARKNLKVDYVKSCTECAKRSTCKACCYRNDLFMAAPMGPLCDPEVDPERIRENYITKSRLTEKTAIRREYGKEI